MRLWPRRRRSTTPAAVVPDRVQIAVLEYELFGIEPQPGTTAAVIIGMRRLGAALRNDPAR